MILLSLCLSVFATGQGDNGENTLIVSRFGKHAPETHPTLAPDPNVHWLDIPDGMMPYEEVLPPHTYIHSLNALPTEFLSAHANHFAKIVLDWSAHARFEIDCLLNLIPLLSPTGCIIFYPDMAVYGADDGIDLSDSDIDQTKIADLLQKCKESDDSLNALMQANGLVCEKIEDPTTDLGSVFQELSKHPSFGSFQPVKVTLNEKK